MESSPHTVNNGRGSVCARSAPVCAHILTRRQTVLLKSASAESSAESTLTWRRLQKQNMRTRKGQLKVGSRSAPPPSTPTIEMVCLRRLPKSDVVAEIAPARVRQVERRCEQLELQRGACGREVRPRITLCPQNCCNRSRLKWG